MKVKKELDAETAKLLPDDFLDEVSGGVALSAADTGMKVCPICGGTLYYSVQGGAVTVFCNGPCEFTYTVKN